MGFKEVLTLRSYQPHTVFLFALVLFGLDNLSLREKVFCLLFILGEGEGCIFKHSTVQSFIGYGKLKKNKTFLLFLTSDIL